ncbi:cysteine desulfurase NifS [Halothermothrix orenii]|uniref:Cysteine desulfurase IscS n=1 Tax=Halothermothrix orenii (strain H 168 / OCM 544 / DSM 9562) TaxID=373903 RepID=B8CWH5_HALOH|nr:cysteine desulfurase NifS [Halothermothrix orenii]ACL69644.1 aminotransferase class V [Halothermothrix orenii H 168]
MKNIYLDNAATTPVAPEVIKVMEPYFNIYYGNPSSVHTPGQDAARAVSEAREKVAELIGARDEREIIFTSGGTEADNLAIKGVAMSLQDRGKHIITSSVEHHAVLHTCEYLEKYLGFDVTYLPVDEKGFVDPSKVEEAIREDTILISIMLANNEIGTIQPVKEIAKIANEHDIYFHTDAVQAIGQIPVDVEKLGVDLLSLSGHKFNGPKGVGALYIRKGVKLAPQMSGGAQERRRRAGTENVPGIVGLGKAAEMAAHNLEEKRLKLKKLRDKLINGIENEIDEVYLNGPRGEDRLPNNVNFCFRYIEGESILLNLDMMGIAGSSGSACTSGSLDPSHVLLAIGRPHEIAHGSLRLTLGYNNTEEEVDYVLEVLPGIIKKLRAMSPLFDSASE